MSNNVEKQFSQAIHLSNEEYIKSGYLPGYRNEEEENDDETNIVPTQRVETRTEDVDPTPSTAGIIEKIILHNFMCHENFELDLGPQMNFIVGKNGSGKSAILTGICVGLGCRANETDRGLSLKNFIKKGKNSCKITIILANKGDGAFESDKYGPRIIIERIIRMEGQGGGYFIKNSESKTISTKKVDLEEILEYFDISIKNPMAFLSQGNAKTFLSGSSNSEKYSFFMKGIQVEQTIKEYSYTFQKNEEIMKDLVTKQETFKVLKKEKDEAEAEYNKFHESFGLRQRQKEIQGKLSWYKVLIKENDHEKLKEKKIEVLNKVKTYQRNLINFKEKMIECENQLNDDSKLDKLKEQKISLEEKRNELKKGAQSFEIKLDDYTKRIDDFKNAKHQKQRRIEKIQKEIKEEQLKYDQKQAQSMTGNKDSLEIELSDLTQKIEELNNERIQIEDSINDNNETLSKFNVISQNEFKEKQKLLQDFNNHKRQIHEFEKNKLAPFGDNITRVLNKIEQEFNAGRFNSKPIGPIGCYVTLKPEFKQYQAVLDRVLPLNSFVVENFHDQNILKNILKQFRCNNNIIKRKFERFNYPTLNSNQDGIFSLLDVLSFKNEDIKYTLIDLSSIEKDVISNEIKLGEKIVNNRQVRNCYCLFNDQSGKKFSMGRSGTFRSDPVYYIQNRLPKLQIDTINGENGIERLIANINMKLSQLNIELQELQLKNDMRKNQYLKEIEKLKTLEKSKIEQVKSFERKKLQVERNIQQIDLEFEENQDNQELRRINRYKNEIVSIEEELMINENSIKEAIEDLENLEEEFKKIDKGKNLLKIESELKIINYKIVSLQKDKEEVFEKKQNLEIDNETLLKKIQKISLVIKKIDENIKTFQEEITTLTNDAMKYFELTNDLKTELQQTNIKNLTKSLITIQKHLEKITKEQLTGNLKSKDEILKTRQETLSKFISAKESLKLASKLSERLSRSLENRIEFTRKNRGMQCYKASGDFNESLSIRNYSGVLVFDHKLQTLSLKVATQLNKEPREINSLSGGEKSFSQIALLLAIWEPMRSRIRGLDEFDVFMDMANRKVSMKLIVEKLRKQPKSQTIFITPQDITNFHRMERNDVKISKLQDPRSR